MSLFLVIVVHGVDNVLLPILDNLPDGPPDHVTRRQSCDSETLTLAPETDSLTVLHLGHLLEARVHLVQSEVVKLFNVVTSLQIFQNEFGCK